MIRTLSHRIPYGVRIITWTTAIRWFGWGLVEALVPVFIFSFSTGYLETGLLSSLYNVIFIISVPIFGALADRTAGTILIIVGLLLYPIIGFSYFLAGMTGLALFILIARGINGVSYALDSVGRDTYFRRHAHGGKDVSTIFGYFETWSNAWWIAGLFVSMVLVAFVPIHWLFLAIIPTDLIGLLFVLRIHRADRDSVRAGFTKVFAHNPFRQMWREIKSWNSQLRTIGLLNFFVSLISTVGTFFVPIYVYTEGTSLQGVILITVVVTLPTVFGFKLGRFADRLPRQAIVIGLGVLACLLALLAISTQYWMQLCIAFGIGITVELVWLACEGIATRSIHNPHRYGKLSGALTGLDTLGGLAGPLALGWLIDRTTPGQAFGTAAVLSVAVLIYIWLTIGQPRISKSRPTTAP